MPPIPPIPPISPICSQSPGQPIPPNPPMPSPISTPCSSPISGISTCSNLPNSSAISFRVVPVAISNSSLSRSGWCSKHSSLMMVLRKIGTNCFSWRGREAASSTNCTNSFGPWTYKNSVLILMLSRTCSTVMSVLRMSSCINGASSGPYLVILAWVSPREVRMLFCSCCSCMMEFCRAIVLSRDCLKYSERRSSLISLGKSLLRSSLCLLERATVLVLRYAVRTVNTLRMSFSEGLLISISALSLLSSSWMLYSGCLGGAFTGASTMPSCSLRQELQALSGRGSTSRSIRHRLPLLLW